MKSPVLEKIKLLMNVIKKSKTSGEKTIDDKLNKKQEKDFV